MKLKMILASGGPFLKKKTVIETKEPLTLESL